MSLEELIEVSFNPANTILSILLILSVLYWIMTMVTGFGDYDIDFDTDIDADLNTPDGMVEVPNDHPEYALDVVTTNEAKEFSQVHLGETIVSDREISEKEALAICDIDNDYVKTWNDETKLNTFITRIKDYE
jgi:hypothetical protein